MPAPSPLHWHFSTQFAKMQQALKRQSATQAGAKGARPQRAARKAVVRAAAAAPAVTKLTEEVVNTCINTIRFLAIDGVNKAKSGHPGLPMGAAPMSYVLWNEAMKYNPKNPQWINRDRFVLSAGHGSMLQYALLHLAGFDSVKVRHGCLLRP